VTMSSSDTAAGRRLVVGIAESAVSGQAGDVIVTHALGSCIAVCIWDPVVKVAGMLHFLLPDSRINPKRALEQPSAFADTGIPLLFQTAYGLGLQKARSIVCLVGGADIAGGGGAGGLNVGRRNILGAKNLLWRNGVLIRNESIGGRIARTVTLSVNEGRMEVTSAGSEVLMETL
jgi:chemotaxis protein CheD